MRSLRSVALAVTGACAPAAYESAVRPGTACLSDGARRWEIPSTGERSVRVWLDVAAQEHDGWRSYGSRRLRFALDEWNSLRLPVRFVMATSARTADIAVDVVQSLPAMDGSTVQNQAGVTNLTYEASGRILKASVLIAVAAPHGRRFPVADQQANLIHELGHAIGLSHITETSAVMATRRTSYQLTGADIELARAHYAACRRP